jgi:DNA-binding transcriptional ArsR family regulator
VTISGQIAAVSTLSRPAVSHHLKILRGAGVLQSRKEGREIWFRVDKELLTGALGAGLDYIHDEV